MIINNVQRYAIDWNVGGDNRDTNKKQLLLLLQLLLQLLSLPTMKMMIYIISPMHKAHFFRSELAKCDEGRLISLLWQNHII